MPATTIPSTPEDNRLVNAGYWVAQLAAWGWHFWWQASGEAIFASVPFWRSALVWGGICLTGLLLTDALRRIAQHRGWLDLPTGAFLSRVAMSVVLLAAALYTVAILLSWAVHGSPVTAISQTFYRRLPLSIQLFNEFQNTLFVVLTWTTVYFGLALVRHRHFVSLRQARLAESLQAAELQLLKSQLNPHFLFNALNGVRALIEDEPTRARESVTQLARMLRYVLDSGREEFVSLGRELEMVEDYLALESLRLAERLRVVRKIDSSALNCRVPVLLLQVLVENAIKHGIADLMDGGELQVLARLESSELVIEVRNPRPIQSDGVESARLGLANTLRRLELLYGARASLSLDLTDPARARATVRLPA